MGEESDHGWNTVRGRHHKRQDNNQHKIDIATSRDFIKDKSNALTTYFFTDFTDSFGAKAMFNAFLHYGDIKEVVIPAKRDKGGQRFRFARFDRVDDLREFEYMLDNIIIGRDKISVNVSRFKRSYGNKSSNFQPVKNTQRDINTRGQYVHHHDMTAEEKTYAKAVRSGGTMGQGDCLKRVITSYEAEKDDLARLEKAFVGVVANPGMMYNIQNGN
ncbi:hypothetical protein TSUD_286130 [Trifolium subterraneum]|uniref:RRM domain-containing protein n=1 Tax=Trifolium subterraneum TaxID=3900 RepID=A0A2Z6P9T8_TRISU|nr:hypothetical protein TSUD_286130 [Trifolium subterraneum]